VTDSATRALARFAATLTYDDLTAEAVAMAKQLTLDTLGTTLAATTLGEGCREVIDVMAALGGAADATILGTAVKVNAPNAALANGALAHALNYDAVGKETGHAGVPTLAAPLAAAEARGPVTGRRFIAAVVAAAEVTARVTGAVMSGERRFSEKLLAGQYFGYFGAAAGAGNIFGLDETRMHSAFGLALMQVSGARQVTVAGDPPAKAIYGAFPNHGGVLAALLAEAGLGAEIDALEGRAGFYAIAAEGVFDRATLLDELGKRWLFLRAQFKPWATSGVVVPFIEAGIALATQHDLHAGDIDAYTVVGTKAMRNWCEPLEERRRPPNGAAAANSTLFAAAKALAHRDVVLADFSPDGLRDSVALALTERGTYRFDETIDGEGGLLEVRTRDGRALSTRVDKPLGHVSRPMSYEQIATKFRDCCRYAPALRPEHVERMIATIAGLERCDDVGVIAQLAAGSAA
jgi:2-methylcitrate dehydratase PrpD